MAIIKARHLNGDHVDMSIVRILHPYIVNEWDVANGRVEHIEPRAVFSEIRMISHTSKKTVKVRTVDGGDMTLDLDDEVEIRDLPRRKPLGMEFGRITKEGGELLMNDNWRHAVYSDLQN